MAQVQAGQVQPLEPQCAWRASDLADEALWTEQLDAAELEELDAALHNARARSDDPLELGRDDFPLPTLAARLKDIERELINGRGIVRIRGIDRARYSQLEMELLYWGIGMHLGSPWPQNRHGHVLGDVTDQGKRGDDPESRGNELGQVPLPFHCDGSDLVGLLCLQAPAEGGLSLVANSVTLHNELVAEAPELAAALYGPVPYDYRGEQAPGGRPWYELPVFTAYGGRLFCRYIRPYIIASQRHDSAPRIAAEAEAAMQWLDARALDPDHHLAMELRPGDMQFINNFHVLHGRTGYRDDRASGQVRHLKRLWLATEELGDRPEHFRSNISHHWGRKATVSRLTAGA